MFGSFWIPVPIAAQKLGVPENRIYAYLRRIQAFPEFYPPELRLLFGMHYKYDGQRKVLGHDMPILLLNMRQDIDPSITPDLLERIKAYTVKTFVKNFAIQDALGDAPLPLKSSPPVYCPHQCKLVSVAECQKCWIESDLPYKPDWEHRPDRFNINQCRLGYTIRNYAVANSEKGLDNGRFPWYNTLV